MTVPVVLDASAILAFLQGEPGQERVQSALHDQQCLVSAANQAEVIAKALDRGASQKDIQTVLAGLAYKVVDINVEDGASAGWMRSISRHLGLSLGDRLCLALAQRLQAEVLTADRLWLEVAQPLGLSVTCIRPNAH